MPFADARMLEEPLLKANGNSRERDEDREEKPTCVEMNQNGLYLQSSETCCPTTSSKPYDDDDDDDDDLNEFSNEWLSIGDLSPDVSFSLEGCVKLEKRWMLWHEFKKDLSSMDEWLRSAEKIAASPNSSHVLYKTAKDELRKYENLRAEARMRLTQLDCLTQRSRALHGLFRGAMGARLVEMTKDCGERWDQLSNTLETVCRRLKHLVGQREDFERQREEMAVWLAVPLRVCWRTRASWKRSWLLFLSPVTISWFWSGTLRWTSAVQSLMTTLTRPPSVLLQVFLAQMNLPKIP
nr:Si:ch211-137a8.2 [Danio rerio]